MTSADEKYRQYCKAMKSRDLSPEELRGNFNKIMAKVAHERGTAREAEVRALDPDDAPRGRQASPSSQLVRQRNRSISFGDTTDRPDASILKQRRPTSSTAIEMGRRPSSTAVHFPNSDSEVEQTPNRQENRHLLRRPPSTAYVGSSNASASPISGTDQGSKTTVTASRDVIHAQHYTQNQNHYEYSIISASHLVNWMSSVWHRPGIRGAASTSTATTPYGFGRWFLCLLFSFFLSLVFAPLRWFFRRLHWFVIHNTMSALALGFIVGSLLWYFGAAIPSFLVRLCLRTLVAAMLSAGGWVASLCNTVAEAAFNPVIIAPHATVLGTVTTTGSQGTQPRRPTSTAPSMQFTSTRDPNSASVPLCAVNPPAIHQDVFSFWFSVLPADHSLLNNIRSLSVEGEVLDAFVSTYSPEIVTPVTSERNRLLSVLRDDLLPSLRELQTKLESCRARARAVASWLSRDAGAGLEGDFDGTYNALVAAIAWARHPANMWQCWNHYKIGVVPFIRGRLRFGGRVSTVGHENEDAVNRIRARFKVSVHEFVLGLEDKRSLAEEALSEAVSMQKAARDFRKSAEQFGRDNLGLAPVRPGAELLTTLVLSEGDTERPGADASVAQIYLEGSLGIGSLVREEAAAVAAWSKCYRKYWNNLADDLSKELSGKVTDTKKGGLLALERAISQVVNRLSTDDAAGS